MKNNEWQILCGYNPCKEQKEMILAMVRDEGISLVEACGRVAMPHIFIDQEPDPLIYDNPYRPAVIIKSRDDE